MITLDMNKKADRVWITDGAFTLENGVLALQISLGSYDLTGKTVTAAFSPNLVETGSLVVTNGVVAIPISPSLVAAGNNHIQLNIRTATTLEQSPVMLWSVGRSIMPTSSPTADPDLIGSILADIIAVEGGKVDKESGKALSTNDFTDTLETKLNGIAEGATNYSHPANHPPSIISQDATNRFVTDTEKTTWNGKQAALGFTPENASNKKTALTDNSDTFYPSQKAVKTAVDVKDINPLYGKIAAFDGDSICSGTMAGDGLSGWAGRIGVANNMTWTNYAVGGATIAYVSPRHCVARNVASMRSDADYVILEGGVNDADLSVPLGTISTGYAAALDDTTFCGAVESMLKQSIIKYAGKKIGYIIVQKMGVGSYPSSSRRRTYFDKAMEICFKWGIPCLNLWDESYLNPNITELNATMYVDGEHISTAGYDVITPRIEAWMKTLESGSWTRADGMPFEDTSSHYTTDEVGKALVQVGSEVDALELMARPSRVYAQSIEYDFYYLTTSDKPQGMVLVALNGGTLSSFTAPRGNPGVWAFLSSTSANSGHRLQTQGATMVLGGGEYAEMIFANPLDTVTKKIRFGFHDSAAIETEVTDGMWIEIVGDGTGAIVSGKTANNGTISTTATTSARLGKKADFSVPYRVSVELSADKATATFKLFNSLTDELLWSDTLTTNIPTTEGRATGFGLICGNTAASTADILLYIDYFSMKINRALTR